MSSAPLCQERDVRPGCCPGHHPPPGGTGTSIGTRGRVCQELGTPCVGTPLSHCQHGPAGARSSPQSPQKASEGASSSSKGARHGFPGLPSHGQQRAGAVPRHPPEAQHEELRGLQVSESSRGRLCGCCVSSPELCVSPPAPRCTPRSPQDKVTPVAPCPRPAQLRVVLARGEIPQTQREGRSPAGLARTLLTPATLLGSLQIRHGREEEGQ